MYVALEPVDMRMGYERLGGLVRERMRAEPRSKALLVFVGKRGHTMKVLIGDGTGAIVVHKKFDAGTFELPKATRVGDQPVIVSDAIFEVIGASHKSTTSRGRPAHTLSARIAQRWRTMENNLPTSQAIRGRWRARSLLPGVSVHSFKGISTS